MTSLYPDESYCTSQIGRLLFQPKNEWAVVGVVVDVAEVKQIAGAHIDYRIEIKLYLRGTFPQFAAPRLIGSTDPAVTAERRRSIDEFLAFVFDSEVLRKARVLQEWVESFTATHSATNLIDEYMMYFRLDQNGDSAEEDSSPDSSVELSRSASAGEFQFPDVVITAEETDAELLSRRTRKSSVLERLFPKLSPSSQYSSQAMKPTGSGDYLVHAAHLVSTAQRAEHEHAYELAFQCYKSAASSLIQGIQRESDMSRKNAVRRKTAKYLVAAERLYRTHLAYDGAAATINLESLVDSTMSDPDVLAFQCANNCLRNYRVVGVLPNLSAAKWVLKVEEKSTGRPYVMKLLEKGTRTTKSRVLLPTNVPHMVQLHQFFETEILIILVLDYIENGTLWSFLNLGKYNAWLDKRVIESGKPALFYNLVRKRLKKTSSIPTHFSVNGAKVFDDLAKADLLAEHFASVYSVHDDDSLALGFQDLPVQFSTMLDSGRYFSESETRFLLSLAAASNSEGNDACPPGEAAPSKLNPNDPYRGDFCVVGDGNDDQLSSHEESPAKVLLPCRDSAADANSDTAYQTLLGCISNVRLYLRRERRKAWPARLRLPEPLIVHWTAQIVSWLYVMHNEHGEVIGDLRPDNLLIDMDGNLQMSYYGKWHYTGRPKEIVEGYSAPECFKYGWVPNMANDVWSLAAIMFELLSGRSLASAAPHGVTNMIPHSRYGELPFPENAEISFAARDLLSQLLTDASSRLTLEAVRAHAFFRTIDWSLYDNPHSVPLNKESSSLASSSLADLRRSRESGESDSGLPLYVPDLLDVAVSEDCE
ncbi:unnamed protein product [Nippostrongylus brasiliensis]|uniref:Ribosomal protein S6 kinase delta-1 (inferred by orthology to a human protein) n=1 Tax=Nippostrongylus brasiliensis TaxID=27835 RepID=A0A158QXV9_NIPBR|nr:unnamed protein product [Nippostrongylus brasiliensis]